MKITIIKWFTNCCKGVLVSENKETLSILEYWIAGIVLSAPKTILLFVIAYFTGLLNRTLILTFLSYGLLRRYSRGIHAKSSLGCFTVGLVNYLGTAFLAGHVAIPYMVALPTYAVCCILFYLYAPSGTEKRPVGVKEYQRDKKISLVILSLYCIIAFFSNEVTRTVLTIVTVLQAVSITPLIFNIAGQKGGVIYQPQDKFTA